MGWISAKQNSSVATIINTVIIVTDTLITTVKQKMTAEKMAAAELTIPAFCLREQREPVDDEGDPSTLYELRRGTRLRITIRGIPNQLALSSPQGEGGSTVVVSRKIWACSEATLV